MEVTFNKSSNLLLNVIILFFPLFLILGNALTNLALFLVSVIYIIECFNNKKILYLQTYEFRIFSIFYLYIIVNSALSDQISISLIRSICYVKYFIFVIIYLHFFEEKKIDLKKIGIIWISVIFILSLDIIYQSYSGENILGFNTGNPYRNSGFFFDELVAGGFILSLSFISTYLINEKNNLKIINYFFLLFCLTVCILTGERSNTIKFITIFFLIHFFLIKFDINLLIKK